MYMVWFVCKMRLWHMCTFASENLTVKGLITYLYESMSAFVIVMQCID